MNDYTLGLLTLPAVVLCGWLMVVSLHWLAVLAGKAAVSALRFGPEAESSKRASVASAFFAGKRVWMFAADDFGIAVIAGQRQGDERRTAYRKLTQVELRKIRAVDQPKRRSEEDA